MCIKTRAGQGFQDLSDSYGNGVVLEHRKSDAGIWNQA